MSHGEACILGLAERKVLKGMLVLRLQGLLRAWKQQRVCSTSRLSASQPAMWCRCDQRRNGALAAAGNIRAGRSLQAHAPFAA
jgi:hypothetical protein